VVSVSGKLCQPDAFADATVVSDPNILLNAIRKTLKKAESPTPWTTARRDKREKAAAAQGKKPPVSSVNYELQTNSTEEGSVPLAHAG
jgi:hypothetical protein